LKFRWTEKMADPQEVLFDFRQRTASTFEGRSFLAVEKDTAKSRTALGKPAKELAFPTPTFVFITFIRFIYENEKRISIFGQIKSK